ncbi:hypothetical protein BDZ45DRAFT_679478 [Acephala macrosclerotiorum]|nr:hypothetical protein BDZ45DRAFT_679478 [Acephala macrosclerotiorum]
MYTAKDKLADWLEAYPSLMEPNVWTSTEYQNHQSTEQWFEALDCDSQAGRRR